MSFYNHKHPARGSYGPCQHGNKCLGHRIHGGYGVCKFDHPDRNIHGDPKITNRLTDIEQLRKTVSSNNKYIKQLHDEIDNLKYLNERFRTVIESYKHMHNVSKKFQIDEDRKLCLVLEDIEKQERLCRNKI